MNIFIMVMAKHRPVSWSKSCYYSGSGSKYKSKSSYLYLFRSNN